jgi:hypothetical protein
VTPQLTSTRRSIVILATAAILLAAGTAAFLYFDRAPIHFVTSDASGNLPSRLSSAEFWSLMEDFSEPDGYFRSDNFLSNETGFQEIIPLLLKTVKPGGVYLGVGPEQNFTYIGAIQPRIAFIIDIRRQNMIEHLLYKAFFELASDRADFVSRLFARPRPSDLSSVSTAEEIFRAFDGEAPNRELFKANLQSAMDRLREDGVPSGFLTLDDRKSMDKVYEAFFESGPDLSYSFIGTPQRFGPAGMPSYSTLMTATDNDGMNWSYLASEENFKRIQKLQRNNLIVPLTGNFAGDKAIRAVGKYVDEHRAAVSVFYLSNVEQYLFQQNDDWSRFYTNVSALPINAGSTFIRSMVFGRGVYNGPGRVRSPLTTGISSMGGLVRAFQAGQIHRYYDVYASSTTTH